MLPWCVWFTIVHMTAGVASKFYTATWKQLSHDFQMHCRRVLSFFAKAQTLHKAMSAHSMLPCVSMEDATHLTLGIMILKMRLGTASVSQSSHFRGSTVSIKLFDDT